MMSVLLQLMSAYALYKVTTLRSMSSGEFEDISEVKAALQRDEITELDQLAKIKKLNESLRECRLVVDLALAATL